MNPPAGNTSASGNVNSPNSPYVVVIGGMNMDIHGVPNSRLLLKDSNPGTVRTSPGGVARNIAENISRLGAACRLISAVGSDQHGRQLLEQGTAAGIDMQHVSQIDSEHTSTYLSIIDGSGDMHVAISDMTIIDRLGPQQLQVHKQLLNQAALVVLDTNLSEDALAWLAGGTEARPLFVDSVSTAKAVKIRPHLNSVHTLKTNLMEAEELAGFEVKEEGDLPKIADWFHQQGLTRLFVTLGKDGVYVSDGNKQSIYKLPEEQAAPVNAGGAGDAFVAGLAYSWLNDWDINKTVGFAMAASSVAIADQRTNNPELSLELVTRVYESSNAN